MLYLGYSERACDSAGAGEGRTGTGSQAETRLWTCLLRGPGRAVKVINRNA